MLQLRDDVAQLEARLDRVIAARGIELRIEVGVRQTKIIEVQDARPRPHHEPERIDVGDQVTAIGVDLDQPRDRGLLGPRGS